MTVDRTNGLEFGLRPWVEESVPTATQVLPASVLVSTGFVSGVVGFELTAQAVQPFPICTKRDAAA
jgi:predicted hotdog family 3-hydroxylacyl-ACP dehydratase